MCHPSPRPADPLLVIVPDGSTLVVDAMVMNRDAGFVREGQEVRVKLEAFPFTRYGVVQGRLTFLSRDAVQDENLGLVFPARVELRQFSINVNGHATPLTAGLGSQPQKSELAGAASLNSSSRPCSVEWKKLGERDERSLSFNYDAYQQKQLRRSVFCGDTPSP